MGLLVLFLTAGLGVALATWSVSDPSLNHATDAPVHNAFGAKGAIVADLIMQLIGVSSIALLAPLALLGWRVLTHRPVGRKSRQFIYWILGAACSAAVASLLPTTDRWPLPTGLGGVIGDAIIALPKHYFSSFGIVLCGVTFLSMAFLSLTASAGFGSPFEDESGDFANDHGDFGKADMRPAFLFGSIFAPISAMKGWLLGRSARKDSFPAARGQFQPADRFGPEWTEPNSIASPTNRSGDGQSASTARQIKAEEDALVQNSKAQSRGLQSFRDRW